VKWGPHSRNESIYGHPSVKLGTFQTYLDARKCRENSGVAHVGFVTQNILIIVKLHYYNYFYYYYLRNEIFFLSFFFRFKLCVQLVVYVSIIYAENDSAKWSKPVFYIFHGYGNLYVYNHDTPHFLGPSGRMISPKQRPLPDENTQHSQETNIHAPRGIGTRSLVMRTAADQSLSPRGHLDRHIAFYIFQ
jgi:hypothetical protein